MGRGPERPRARLSRQAGDAAAGAGSLAPPGGADFAELLVAGLARGEVVSVEISTARAAARAHHARFADQLERGESRPRPEQVERQRCGEHRLVCAVPGRKARGRVPFGKRQRDGTLHFYNAETGAALPDKLPRAQYPTGGGSAAWTADGTGIFYTRYPAKGERPNADLHFFQQIYFHKLGTPVEQDAYMGRSSAPRCRGPAVEHRREAPARERGEWRRRRVCALPAQRAWRMENESCATRTG